MATILFLDGWIYVIYSNEGNPPEPPHIHISKGEASIKIWLEDLKVEYAYNIGSSDLKRIKKVVESNRSNFLKRYYEIHKR